jgi:hypothetical protein
VSGRTELEKVPPFWTFPVYYAWFKHERGLLYAPGHLDAKRRVFHRWKGVTVRFEDIPNTGPYGRTPVLDGSKFTVVFVDPPVWYLRLREGEYAPGYLDPEANFYRWRGVTLREKELPTPFTGPGKVLTTAQLRELDVVEIDPPSHLLDTPGAWKKAEPQ